MIVISENIIDFFGNKLQQKQAKQINILTLAYLGDSIHDLFVRSKISTTGDDKRINTLHKQAVTFVNANAQADCLDFILDELSEDEQGVYKRGRNSKSMPTKNTDKAHYSKSTGFEAVIGYLYVSGQDERLLYILNKCYNFIYERRK